MPSIPVTVIFKFSSPAPAVAGAAGCIAKAEVTKAKTSVIPKDRKSTRLNSSHHAISYAVFCLKKNVLDQLWSSVREFVNHRPCEKQRRRVSLDETGTLDGAHAAKPLQEFDAEHPAVASCMTHP